MAAPQNTAPRSESKSASKKKKSKATGETVAPVDDAPAPVSEATPESNNGDGSYESPYLKELYKNIRNVNKKITNASKSNNILAENPKSTLDELVSARKINADQKAQILKLPSLKAALAQHEEQIVQFKKFDQEYKANLATDKANFEKSIKEQHAKELEQAVATAKLEVEREQKRSLLIISQFLHLAAVRRGEDADADLDENKALEGALTWVYEGSEKAVAVMLKIVQGVSEPTVSISNEQLSTTYADIKNLVISLNAQSATQDLPAGEDTAVETAEYPVESDPTIANAGLTEIDEPTVSALTNGHAAESDIQGAPQNSNFGEGGNAAAESNWDTNNDLSTSQEWVEVPRDATETDTGLTATPAAPSNTQSWADDQPDSPAEAPTSAPAPNDGFHEVTNRSRGGNRGDGGRGRGGHNRGRGGHRGDGRGRGRGGPRGGQGGGRGGRRPDES